MSQAAIALKTTVINPNELRTRLAADLLRLRAGLQKAAKRSEGNECDGRVKNTEGQERTAFHDIESCIILRTTL
jgi:hypothetical protein